MTNDNTHFRVIAKVEPAPHASNLKQSAGMKSKVYFNQGVASDDLSPYYKHLERVDN
jgi:hypothetical protein